MSPLTPEQGAAVDELLAQAVARLKAVPESERVRTANPDKYAFPIGLNDAGQPFPPEPPTQAASDEDAS